MLINPTTLQQQSGSSQEHFGMVAGLRVQSTRHQSQSGDPDLMQGRTKCSPSFPKETAEPAQSYLHPGSGESAPDWKIPFPPMETWSNNVPDPAWEPRLTDCACLGHGGFPEPSNPPSSAMQLLGPARLEGECSAAPPTRLALQLGCFGLQCTVEIPSIPGKVLCISALLGQR